MIDWTRVRYFTAKEKWGEADSILPELVYELDKYRDFVGTAILITSGTQGKHSQNSLHYSGRAVDVIFPKGSLKFLPDLFLSALRFRFSGVGVYPAWGYMGTKCGGLHLEISEELNPVRKYWIGVPGEKQSQVYLPLTMNLLLSNCPVQDML